MLVAVFMLFVVGAMAALSIDVVTLYTARSEAQLAADGAALAGARAFANSGVTSDASRQVDQRAPGQPRHLDRKAGRGPKPGQEENANPDSSAGEITVSFPNETDTAFDTNPHVTVSAQRARFADILSRGSGDAPQTRWRVRHSGSLQSFGRKRLEQRDDDSGRASVRETVAAAESRPYGQQHKSDLRQYWRN